jgi:hypothetical protein
VSLGIISTQNGERRKALLNVCRSLRRAGDFLYPQHEIIRKMVAAFETTSQFDWRTVNVRFTLAEKEIEEHESFDDELARQERDESRAYNKRFVKVYGDAQPAFENLFRTSPDQMPRKLSEKTEALQVEGGAFWIQAATLCSRIAKHPYDEATVRSFVGQCPPFRTLMVALFAAQYDRCIRTHSSGPSLRSGRNDTFMSVSLPYCNTFVTNDLGQLACYREVASLAELDVDVSRYDVFRNRFSVMGESVERTHA